MSDVRNALTELVACIETWVVPLHSFNARLEAALADAIDALAQEPAPPYINPEGNTCSHHPDDPAHGPQCVYYPAPTVRELSDAECNAAITKANMDAHEGPFVPISELTAEQLWKYYRAIYRAGRRSAT